MPAVGRKVEGDRIGTARIDDWGVILGPKVIAQARVGENSSRAWHEESPAVLENKIVAVGHGFLEILVNVEPHVTVESNHVVGHEAHASPPQIGTPP